MFHFHRHVCARRLSDIGCSRCGARGFVEGTTVHVRGGWRVAEALKRGDRLRVFPTGEARLSDVAQESIWLDPVDCPAVVRPLWVPPGALGNDTGFLLQQEMRVLMHDPAMRKRLGAAHVTVRSDDLIGFRGIAPAAPPKGARLIVPDFGAERIVQIAGGAWVHCPPRTQSLAALANAAGATVKMGDRPVRHLTAAEADAFLAAQEALDSGVPGVTPGYAAAVRAPKRA